MEPQGMVSSQHSTKEKYTSQARVGFSWNDGAVSPPRAGWRPGYGQGTALVLAWVRLTFSRGP